MMWSSKMEARALLVLGSAGCLAGLVLQPPLVARLLSSDGVLAPETVTSLYLLDGLAFGSGLLLALYAGSRLGSNPLLLRFGQSVDRGILRLEHHWFAPLSPRYLAVARIVLVVFQLVYCTVASFIGLDSDFELVIQLHYASIDDSLYEPLFTQKLMLWPLGWGARPGPELLRAVWALGLLSGLLSLLGLFTRTNLLVFAWVNTLLCAHAYSYHQVHHSEGLLMLALWLLALGPSGESLSLDAWRRRGAPSHPEVDTLARWPLRTVQWLLVLVYLSAGASKLAHGGIEWMNGHTLAYYLAQDALRHGLPLGLWLAKTPIPFLAFLSVITVVFELTFAVAIFRPRLAWLYLLTGAGLHLGIFFTQRAAFFELVALYVVFLPALLGKEGKPMKSYSGRIGLVSSASS